MKNPKRNAKRWAKVDGRYYSLTFNHRHLAIKGFRSRRPLATFLLPELVRLAQGQLFWRNAEVSDRAGDGTRS